MGSLGVVACADDMEPEDMKTRRLAALEEFRAQNPEYETLIEVQLRRERRGATEAKQQKAKPWRFTRKGPLGPRPIQIKKSRWTTESSLGLLDAVARFERSGSRAIGKEKWSIVAADLRAHQPVGSPFGAMSVAESADYCRIRYSNMLARRHTPDALTAELREKLEQFSRLVRESLPRPPRRTPSRKNRCAIALQKKSRMLHLATLKYKSSITM